MAALGGLFPPGAQFPQSVTGKGSTAVRNVPLNGDAIPLSSMENFSSFADKVGPLYHALSSNDWYQLTAGLRPGRGEAIPDAADVPAFTSGGCFFLQLAR